MPTVPLAVCPSPIFVIGCPRSGTTVLARALARHPDCWTGEESDFLGPLARELDRFHVLGTRRAGKHWLSSQGVSLAELRGAVGLGLNALYTGRAGGKRWVDHSPLYTLYLEDLGQMFPAARFVHVLRDGRDVVVSMLASGFPAPWARDFELACRTWVANVMAARAFGAAHPGRLVTVRNEALRDQPREALRELLGTLGLDYEDGVARDFVEGRRVNSSFAEGEPRPSWREWSPERLAAFQRIAGGFAAKL